MFRKILIFQVSYSKPKLDFNVLKNRGVIRFCMVYNSIVKKNKNMLNDIILLGSHKPQNFLIISKCHRLIGCGVK